MKINELNIDVLHEIFHSYVSMADEGPFGLILVCKHWRDTVVRLPKLWSYILLDSSLSGWEERVEIGLALSKKTPLTIILRLPFDNMKVLELHKDRIANLIISLDSLPDYTPSSPYAHALIGRIETLLLSAGFRYKGYVAWHLNNIEAYLATKRLTLIFQSIDFRALDLERCCPALYTSYCPGYSPHDENYLQDLFKYKPSFNNLRHLEIIGNALHRDPPMKLPSTPLWTLEVLKITYAYFIEDDLKPSSFLCNFLPSVVGPSIRAVNLKGPLDNLLHIASGIKDGICPSSLSLFIMDHPLEITFEGSCSGLGRLLHVNTVLPPQAKDFNDLLPLLDRTILCEAINMKSCTIVLDAASELPALLFPSVSCSLSISYRKASKDPVFPESPIDTLTFHVEPQHPNQPNARLPDCHKLCYRSLDDNRAGIIHHPVRWPLDIEELDCDSCRLGEDFFIRSRHHDLNLLPFSRLRVISCTTRLATALLGWRLLPNIEKLALISAGSDSVDAYHFGVLTNTLTREARNSYSVATKLQQLTVKYFPLWSRLFDFLEILYQNGKKPSELKLELNGWPHPSIVQIIVRFLNGERVARESNEFHQMSPKDYEQQSLAVAPGCYNCYCTGWECDARVRHTECTQFAQCCPVFITRDTLADTHAAVDVRVAIMRLQSELKM